MADESLREEYSRLLREGRTGEATALVSESGGQEEEEDTEAHMVYTELNGVGEELAEEMFEEFGDWQSFVEEASVERLSDISGIGEKRAESLLEQLE